MAELTLGQAARLCGRGKTTLTRAIRSGRLSASRRDDGGYLINVAELERVFPLVTVAATGDVAHHATPDATAAIFEAQIAGLREVGDLLRRQLDGLGSFAVDGAPCGSHCRRPAAEHTG